MLKSDLVNKHTHKHKERESEKERKKDRDYKLNKKQKQTQRNGLLSHNNTMELLWIMEKPLF